MKKLVNSRILKQIERLLVFLIPISVFFSYYPVLSLGSDESMNFEFSIPLIVLLIFGIISILRIPRIILKNSLKKILFFALVPIFSTISIFWSENKIRGILTVGIIWLIYFSALNIVYNLIFIKKDKNKLLTIYLVFSAIIAILCLLQCLLDVLGASNNFTLLCAGCTYMTFGFPHPNGFAIEPQFMGNLLILPCIISIFITYNAILKNKSNSTIIKYLLLTILLNMSLYVVFSRGAIYSYIVAIVLLCAILFAKSKKTLSFTPIAIVIISFACGLFYQGFLAELSPTNEGFREGIARSVHQMSLGRIDFRARDIQDTTKNQSSFDGYIEESTDIRLNLNDIALSTWKKSPIVGVGIGGSGVAISKNSELNSKEIIQNEFITILLELGLVGFILIISLILYILYHLFKARRIISFSTLIAYLLSMFFFAGLPNVLHIYLLMPLLYKNEKMQHMLKYKNE